MLLKLPEKLRSRLKEPLGELIRGGSREVEEHLKSFLEGFKGEVVTVGDVISQNFIEAFYTPKLSIVDFRSLRRPYSLEYDFTVHFNFWVEVYNPPATITSELLDAIRTCLKLKGRSLIIVRGEEDLATLPVIVEAPLKTVVLYGQPGEGVVLVYVDCSAKEKAKKYLEMFERID